MTKGHHFEENLEASRWKMVADDDNLLKTLENLVSAKKSYMHLRRAV